MIIGKIFITLFLTLMATLFGRLGLDALCESQPSWMPKGVDIAAGLLLVAVAVGFLLAAASVWFCPE